MRDENGDMFVDYDHLAIHEATANYYLSHIIPTKYPRDWSSRGCHESVDTGAWTTQRSAVFGEAEDEPHGVRPLRI